MNGEADVIVHPPVAQSELNAVLGWARHAAAIVIEGEWRMSFLNFVQVVSLENAKYRRVRRDQDDQNKREMYALEKRVAAGETLGPIELSFLLSMQDKLGRKPAVADDFEIPEVKLAPPPDMPPIPEGQYRYEPPSLFAKCQYLAIGVGLSSSYLLFTRAIGIDFAWYTDSAIGFFAAVALTMALGGENHVVKLDGEAQ